MIGGDHGCPQFEIYVCRQILGFGPLLAATFCCRSMTRINLQPKDDVLPVILRRRRQAQSMSDQRR